MTRLVASSVFFMIALVGVAQQFSSELFHKGMVVTSRRDTVEGEVKYDLETNALLVKSNGKMKSFSGQNVAYFELFDQLQNNYRRFYTMPYQVNYGYKAPVFFEVIYEGKVSLLAREVLVQQTVNPATTYWGGPTYTQWVIDYQYFFLDNKGTITVFSGKKKDLLSNFPKKQQQLKNYIRDNRLDVSNRADLVRVMSFYNSI